MCPYYDKSRNLCKIYKTLQTNNYNREAYCEERMKDHTECPNYKQCERSYGGIVPPPYKF